MTRLTSKAEAAPADLSEFVLRRHFAAPRSLVYKCFSDPGHVARWFGPKNFTCPISEADLRPGGKFRIVMRGPDGTDYPIKGVFREIIPEVRIVKGDDVSEHNEAWHDMIDPARDKSKVIPRINILTSFEFADADGGTLVTIRTRFDTIAMRDNFVRAGMYEGWTSSLEKLDELLDALKVAPNQLRFTRILDAPRELVFKAFSDPQGLAKWWGPNGFMTTTHEMDFRVGGVWRFTMHGPDGTDYPNYVTYTEIVSPARIAYDHGTDAQHPAMFKAVIALAEEGKKTRVTLGLTLSDTKHRDEVVAFGAVEGGWQTLARLGEYLAEQRALHDGE